MIDCIIVGGGPAGLTAALYLARFLRSVRVIDAGQGRARMIPCTHNLPPFPDGIPGPDLLGRMRASAERYGAVIDTGTVVSVDRRGGVFHVSTAQRAHSARTVILACGVFNHRPPLSPEDHDRGLARGLIRYCPVCDAHEVRGQRIAVLGSGQHGFEEARFVCDYSPFVTLIPADGSVATAHGGVGALDAAMTGLAVSDTQVLVTLATGEVRSFDTMYVALGTTALSGLSAGIGVGLDDTGHMIVDAKQRTEAERVYAIGDLTHGLDQIAVAMGQGAVAATAIHNDLREADQTAPDRSG